MAEQEGGAGALSLDHDRDGVLVLRLSGGGDVIPKVIPVVDGETDTVIALYTATRPVGTEPTAPVPHRNTLDLNGPV
ncbi:hypothetical protein [Streptomyces sp. NPDC053048]|uniref:hypothetical protein n=1 Tax=Streptomyces sp. NPDC053048 TaxID=3365694 RepID=UPI0037D43B12